MGHRRHLNRLEWWERPAWRVLMSRLSSDVSPLRAAFTISLFSLVVATTAAIAMRIVDPEEYPTFGTAAWWALQTVTTVGYGDVAPQTVSGRIVASLLMLSGISFISVMTAAITALFIQAARGIQEDEDEEDVVERLDARLARIEAALDRPDRGP
jgi:voltage-gated potassium channel Kch